MNNLKDKFRRFMVGRYGTDELNRFILTVVLAMVICNLFIRSGPLIWAELLLLLLSYIRMFSKNTGARFKENQGFLNLRFRAQENIKTLNTKFLSARTAARSCAFPEATEKSVSTAGNAAAILWEKAKKM